MAGTKISDMPAVGSSGATALAEADLIPVVDTSVSTNRKCTRAQLRQQIADSPTDLAVLRYSSGSTDWLVTTPSAMITGLPAITTLADADVLPINQSTTGSKVTVTQLRAQLPLASPVDGNMVRYNDSTATWEACTPNNLRWRTIRTSRYTSPVGATPSVITMSDTSDFQVGYPVKCSANGAPCVGIVTAISSNTSITVAGDALAVGATVSSLKVGMPSMVRHVLFHVSGAYGDGANDLLANDMNTYFKWPFMQSHLVRYSAVHKVAASTTQPKINVKVGGSLVGTQDSNNGVQLSTAGTWVDCTLAEVDYTNGWVQYNESIEVACTVAGNGVSEATGLTVLCTFVESE